MGETAGGRLEGTAPSLVEGAAAVGRGKGRLSGDFREGGFHSTGLDDRDQVPGLGRCGARGFQHSGHALLGDRGRYLVHGDQR